MTQEKLSEKKGEEHGGLSAPTIALPKGGGATRGMGEKFSANPVTGTGSMSVPIATSPGRSGFGPQLSLAYDSSAGNGLDTLGWTLSLPPITRETETGFAKLRRLRRCGHGNTVGGQRAQHLTGKQAITVACVLAL